MVRLFWSSPIFGRKICCENLQSAKGSTQWKSDPGNTMASRCNHLLHHFQVTIHLHLASFFATKYFKTKLPEKNALEQIIKFELRGLGPLGRICTSATNYFHDKTKISKENLRVDVLFTAKILQEAMHLAFPYQGQIN